MYIGLVYSIRKEFRSVVRCIDCFKLTVLGGWATSRQCLIRGFSLADAMESMFIDLEQVKQLYKKFSTMAAEPQTCTYKLCWIELAEHASLHGTRK